MSKKAGNILLLALIFILGLGAAPMTVASPKSEALPNQASTCSSTLVSTQLCNDISKSACTGRAQKPLQKQIAGAVAIANPKDNNNPVKTEIVIQTLEPTVTASEETHDAQTPDIIGVTPDDTPLDSNLIFNMINEYRVSLGLSVFEKENSVCSLATVRANEIIDEIAGRAGYLHSGLYNRGLDYWIWENAKYGSNEAGTVAWWKASPVHHQSIVGDFKYSCVACNGTYCVQLFTSFSPKNATPEPETLQEADLVKN